MLWNTRWRSAVGSRKQSPGTWERGCHWGQRFGDPWYTAGCWSCEADKIAHGEHRAQAEKRAEGKTCIWGAVADALRDLWGHICSTLPVSNAPVTSYWNSPSGLAFRLSLVQARNARVHGPQPMTHGSWRITLLAPLPLGGTTQACPIPSHRSPSGTKPPLPRAVTSSVIGSTLASFTSLSHCSTLLVCPKITSQRDHSHANSCFKVCDRAHQEGSSGKNDTEGF